MTRKLFRKALLAGLAAVLTVLATVFGVSYRRADPEALAHVYTFPGNGNTTHLHIDADITNGARPCDPVDDTATVAVGAAHKVGVCIEDYVPNSIDAFELYIRYTGNPDATPSTTLNVAQTLTGPAPMLDLNPDANDGDDPTGFKLGGGWLCDCFGLPMCFPKGDDPRTPGLADALIFCYVDLVNPDQDLTASPGLLATIEFTASKAGTDTIDFGPIDDTNWNNVQNPRSGGGIARCGPQVADDQVGCFGAAIVKYSPAVGGIAELVALAGPSGEEADAPAGGSGWSVASYGALAGGLAAVVAMAAGTWHARRRWLK
jgi:hypothetical protein